MAYGYNSRTYDKNLKYTIMILSVPQGHAWGVETFHVMTTFHVLMNITFSGATKSFNGEKFSFLHYQKLQ
jgi:hypothetical protein